MIVRGGLFNSIKRENFVALAVIDYQILEEKLNMTFFFLVGVFSVIDY